MKRRITRVYIDTNAKLQVDRFFEVCRTNLHIFAFQDRSAIEVNCLNEHNVRYLITTMPKRKFFIDNNTLIDEGFEIYFNKFSNELIERVKYEAIKHLGNKFFIKFVRNDNRNEADKSVYSGKIIFKNLKKKEEKAND